MSKVASIPADVWDKQIAPHESARIDFMLIQERNFSTDEELRAELQRLCEKHNISGVIFHKTKSRQNPMNMTELSFKSLTIISENSGITITEFSKKLWVDNPLWGETCRDGKGKGYKMIRMGQNYLDRLLKTGWIKQTYHNTGITKSDRKFYITELGKTAMDDFANQNAAKNKSKPHL